MNELWTSTKWNGMEGFAAIVISHIAIFNIYCF